MELKFVNGSFYMDLKINTMETMSAANKIKTDSVSHKSWRIEQESKQREIEKNTESSKLRSEKAKEPRQQPNGMSAACDWCKSATDVKHGARHGAFKVCVNRRPVESIVRAVLSVRTFFIFTWSVYDLQPPLSYIWIVTFFCFYNFSNRYTF